MPLQDRDSVPVPPEAPPIRRALRFGPTQILGLGLILLLLLLALAGVFEATRIDTATGPSIELEVEYGARQRYGMRNSLRVTVTNASASTLREVRVDVGNSFVDAFSEIAFVPSASAIVGDAYVVELGELPSGASRQVTAHLRADRYGRHEGRVAASAAGEEPASMILRTLVFP